MSDSPGPSCGVRKAEEANFRVMQQQTREQMAKVMVFGQSLGS